jgi:hypothetical protein
MSILYEAPKCQFVRTNGTQCGSPALKEAKLCYYHERDRKRVENFHQARGLKCDDYMNGHPALQASLNPEIMESLEMPALDDAVSIQVALTNLVRAICYEHISEKRAGLALYGLQVAVSNLPKVQLAIAEGQSVATHDPKPIHPFSIGDGYHRHLAQRGIVLLKQQENDERPPTKEEREQFQSEMKKALTSVAKG